VTIFRSIDETLSDIYIEVIAPFEYKDQKEKQRRLETLGNEITNTTAAFE
jgi:hypothetical protein